jgi:CRP-like cAMP-binding protein
MKDPYHKILNLFPEYANAENADKELIEKLFHPIEMKKGSLLVKENTIPQYLYFINTGFVRVYYYHDGEAITCHLNCPNGFITSFGSFMSETRSTEIVECITACSLLQISKKDLDLLYQLSPKWAEAGRKIYDQSIVYNEQRTRDILTLPADQRYLKLLNESPELIQQVPLQIIASFIGIKPESLSRIRRQLIS